jgi:phage portal protein BeeE
VGLLEAVADKQSRSLRTRKAWSQPPFWAYDGLTAPLLSTYPLTGERERIESSFEGYVQAAYKASGVIFACMLVRQLIFAEARFQWRIFRQGRPGELFGSPELQLLEQPWPGGTTGELLARMEVTASLAGNYYATVADDRGRLGRAATGPGRRIVHLRPDWTTIIIDAPSGSPLALDARIVGYLYEPPPAGGGLAQPDPILLLASEVCHYSPLPDPIARFRGMSWLTPVVEEIRADKAATIHKGRFFANGATPNLAIVFDKDVNQGKFESFIRDFKREHQGADKAYKTLFIAGGADPRPLGKDFQQLDFKKTQGGGEERIAAAAGVHPAVVGLAGGLEGSSLNAGNLTAAIRLTANKTMRPLWRIAAASLQTLVTPPQEGASLWYDDRDIAFLREDATDLAEIRVKDAQALRTLVDGGFDADAAVQYVQTNDLNRLLGSHSGLLPVQLRPPGSGEDGQPSPNGNGRPRELVLP